MKDCHFSKLWRLSANLIWKTVSLLCYESCLFIKLWKTAWLTRYGRLSIIKIWKTVSIDNKLCKLLYLYNKLWKTVSVARSEILSLLTSYERLFFNKFERLIFNKLCKSVSLTIMKDCLDNKLCKLPIL